MEEVIWRPILGYELLYKVSNFGDIVSLEKSQVMPGNGFIKISKEKNLSQHKLNNGHLYVDLHKDGKRKRWLVHRLVAINFINNPNNYEIVRHLDDNCENNKYSNLAWGTQKMNMQDKANNNNQQQGEKVFGSKLKEDQISEMRLIYERKELNQYQIAKKFNISQSVVNEIVNRKAWKHIN